MNRWALLFIGLLCIGSTHALTYSTVDWHRLPVYNVYDPFTHRNELITRYSLEELEEMSTSASFRQWNDMTRVCQSMQLMFSQTSVACINAPAPEFPRAPTARAYVMFQVLPRPVAPDPATVLIVDPVYPPWSPTYNPYW
jgi:hypothetical protein